MAELLATPDDVAGIWQPIPDDQNQRILDLIAKASARIRQKAPFDIDARIALFEADAADPKGLDPLIVADVVANIVKRVLTNPSGILSGSETVGPYSRSQVFASRTSDAGDAFNSLSVTDADIDQLRVAQSTNLPATIRVKPGRVGDGFADGDPWLEHHRRVVWP